MRGLPFTRAPDPHHIGVKMRAFPYCGLFGARSFLFALGLAFLASACSGSGPDTESSFGPSPEELEVTEVAEGFLSALSAADTATLGPLLAPQAMIYSVRKGESGPALRVVSRADFLASLGGEEQDLEERMWNPSVLVQDGVAMVWTPYDFHLNGEFSHCGIDVFSLLKGTKGWQVASITYNVVREGCPPSPLGPLERSGE